MFELLFQLMVSLYVKQLPPLEIQNVVSEVRELSLPVFHNVATKTVSRRAPRRKNLDRESLGLKLTSPSYIVLDRASGKVLLSERSDELRTPASITKLMTALVFLEHNPGWEREVPVQAKHKVDGSVMNAEVGDTMTTRQLFEVMLVASKNDATLALAEATDLSRYRFVHLMNEYAREFGMSDTRFVEPTGLLPQNVTTAEDIAKLVHTALTREDIQQATIMRSVSYTTQKFKKSYIDVSTNSIILGSFLNDGEKYRVVGGKTGFIDEAGNCLTSIVSDARGNEVIAVVLGSTTHETRSQDLKSLVSWAFANYEW